MRFPRIRFRLWMVMAAVTVLAGVMAELSQRRARLYRLGFAHHERASALLERAGAGWVCDYSQTHEAIEAAFRRQGPSDYLDYQMGRYHLSLMHPYFKAANRQWFPVLSERPVLDGVSDSRAVAEWGLEAILEAAPVFGIGTLLLIVRAATRKAVA